ncbi:MAG: galactose mutarotase [Erysipelothrix sp.]|nr:galactose mutarotase [Erysipelothrix sp.]
MKRLSDINTYILENDLLKIEISSLGAAILKFIVKKPDNSEVDIVLGHKNLADYITNPGNHGVMIGRNANRIENAKVTIDDKTYDLEANDFANNLHSGSNGLQKRLFDLADVSQDHLVLKTKIQEFSDGFPGNLFVTITYLLKDNELVIKQEATTDKKTIVNICNHSYFNLNGQDNSTIDNHNLYINSNFYMPNTKESIPTKEIKASLDSPYDFTRNPLLKDHLHMNYAEVIRTKGFDNNFLINNDQNDLVAKLYSKQSGISLSIHSDLSAMHVYTGNHFPDPTIGKSNLAYPKHGGIAFETQLSPNSLNMPWLKSPILNVDEVYETYTSFKIDLD